MNTVKTSFLQLAIVAVLAPATCMVLAATSSAVVIDFESFPSSHFASFTQSGVTFSAVGGGGSIFATATPNGTMGLLEDNSPRKELRADIASHASSVSVDLGDFDSDPDTAFLEIFNSANTSLGFTSQAINDAFTGMITLTLSAPNIAYAEFGGRLPAINGSSLFADNFTFTPAPEPSAIVLSACGVFGIAAARRRAKRSVV
jgi:hypothetical protein